MSSGGELLNWSVFVSMYLEEMARPDWKQKAKHLADTCQAAGRTLAAAATEALVQLRRSYKKATLLFQTEKESLTRVFQGKLWAR